MRLITMQVSGFSRSVALVITHVELAAGGLSVDASLVYCHR